MQLAMCEWSSLYEDGSILSGTVLYHSNLKFERFGKARKRCSSVGARADDMLRCRGNGGAERQVTLRNTRHDEVKSHGRLKCALSCWTWERTTSPIPAIRLQQRTRCEHQTSTSSCEDAVGQARR